MNISLPFELSGIEILATFTSLKEFLNPDNVLNEHDSLLVFNIIYIKYIKK